MKEFPTYYSVLPADVRYDRRLSDSEKVLYSEITALASKDGYCFASNSYFADLYGIGISTLQKRIANLVACGYVNRKIVYDEDGKTVKTRYLTIYKPVSTSRPPYLDSETTPISKRGRGHLDSETYSITRGNNTNVNSNSTPTPSKGTDVESLLENVPLGYRETFKEYMEARKEMKKPMTSTAVKMAVKKLAVLPDDASRIACIEESIMNGWQGLFPDRKGKEAPKKNWTAPDKTEGYTFSDGNTLEG